jgi:PAS domain S-box-containing protein
MPTRTEFDPLAQPLRQILDQSGAIVFLKDRDGRYLLVNRGFEDVAGLCMEEIIGKSDEELFPAELALRLRHNDLRVLHELKTLQFEETGDFPAGSGHS